MFIAFSIVAAWLLPLPLWLQIVITIAGVIKIAWDVLVFIARTNDDSYF